MQRDGVLIQQGRVGSDFVLVEGRGHNGGSYQRRGCKLLLGLGTGDWSRLVTVLGRSFDSCSFIQAAGLGSWFRSETLELVRAGLLLLLLLPLLDSRLLAQLVMPELTPLVLVTRDLVLELGWELAGEDLLGLLNLGNWNIRKETYL